VIELLLQAERALSVGLVDQAERMYRQVADADPQNSIAVVGLARVALERADDAGALRMARRALRIDPENVAAVRLVARLEEVMTYRGEALPVAEAAAEVRTAATMAMPPASAAPASPASTAPSPPPQPPTPARRTGLDRLLRRKRP
jgi:predicted Zn-dependent protease